MSWFSRLMRQVALISAMLVLVSLNPAHAEPAASSDKTGQLTIRLVKLPSNTPRDASIFLAGDFNGWNSSDDRYRLTPDAQGQYGITLPASVRDLGKFSLTLGAAPEPVGTNVPGGESTDHPYLIMESETGTIYVAVQSWRGKAVQVSRGTSPPTAAKSVFSNDGLFEKNLVGFFALGFVIVIPGIIYIRHLKRREQVLLSAIEVNALAEYKAKGKDLSDAIATLRSNSKELERWSRAVER